MHAVPCICSSVLSLENFGFYCQTFNIGHTLVGNKIVDHSDVVGAVPVGAAPSTSSFSTQRLASMDWAKTTARRDEKQKVLWFGMPYIKRFYSNFYCRPTYIYDKMANALQLNWFRCIDRTWHIKKFLLAWLLNFSFFNTDYIWFRRKLSQNPQPSVLLALGHCAVGYMSLALMLSFTSISNFKFIFYTNIPPTPYMGNLKHGILVEWHVMASSLAHNLNGCWLLANYKHQ